MIQEDQRYKGSYLGTEIDGKFWKRYTKDGLFARGTGEFWFDKNYFYFLRYLTKEPVVIPYSEIDKIKIGRWHSGRWIFNHPILKIVWNKEKPLSICPGFYIPKNTYEVKEFIESKMM